MNQCISHWLWIGRCCCCCCLLSSSSSSSSSWSLSFFFVLHVVLSLTQPPKTSQYNVASDMTLNRDPAPGAIIGRLFPASSQKRKGQQNVFEPKWIRSSHQQASIDYMRQPTPLTVTYPLMVALSAALEAHLIHAKRDAAARRQYHAT